MIRGKGKHIMMALLCTSMLMGVGSCCKTAETGKKTNHTDYSAPKIINSDQICEFYASFYLGD